jgi:hypothetical protein
LSFKDSRPLDEETAVDMDQTWAGVEFKLAAARFHLGEMYQQLIPAVGRPEFRDYQALMSSPGTIVGGSLWQPALYYHLDGFLAAGRSVPDIIQAQFGRDTRASGDWLRRLSAEERERREQFQQSFSPIYTAFGRHPVSRARVVTMHRTGLPPVEVQVTGYWGVVYRGGPTEAIPALDARLEPTGDDPAKIVPAISSPAMPLEPKAGDFSLQAVADDGGVQRLPLFDACREYLQQLGALVEGARQLARNLHGSQPLTPPPAA